MPRVALVLLLALFAVTSPGTANAGVPFVRGDADGDSVINIVDGIVLLNYLSGLTPAPGCLDAADVNDDGSVDVVDAVHVLYFLFAPGTAPPAFPFPDCDVDPTIDGLDCIFYVCP